MILPNLHRDFLSRLPLPLAHHILRFTEPTDLCTVAVTCKEWLKLVKHHELWQKLYSDLGLGVLAPHHYVRDEPLGMNARRLHVTGNWVCGRFSQRSFGWGEMETVDGEGILTMVMHARIAVTGSTDGMVRMWDVAQGQLLRTFIGHKDSVCCLQFDGYKILSGSADGTVRMWGASGSSELFVLKEHSGTVTCLKLLNALLITGSADTTLRIWWAHNPRDYNPHIPKTMATPVCIRVLHGHQAAVKALDFNPTLLVSASLDATLRLWHIGSGNCLRVIVPSPTTPPPTDYLPPPISCLQLSSHSLVLGTYHGSVFFYSLRPQPTVSSENVRAHPVPQPSPNSFEEFLAWASRDDTVTLRNIFYTSSTSVQEELRERERERLEREEQEILRLQQNMALHHAVKVKQPRSSLGVSILDPELVPPVKPHHSKKHGNANAKKKKANLAAKEKEKEVIDAQAASKGKLRKSRSWGSQHAILLRDVHAELSSSQVDMAVQGVPASSIATSDTLSTAMTAKHPGIPPKAEGKETSQKLRRSRSWGSQHAIYLRDVQAEIPPPHNDMSSLNLQGDPTPSSSPIEPLPQKLPKKDPEMPPTLGRRDSLTSAALAKIKRKSPIISGRTLNHSNSQSRLSRDRHQSLSGSASSIGRFPARKHSLLTHSLSSRKSVESEDSLDNLKGEKKMARPITKQWILSLKMDSWRIICGRKDGKVIIWNHHTQKQLAELYAETEAEILHKDKKGSKSRNQVQPLKTAITGIGFDDKYVVASGMDGEIKVWEVVV
jgi:WD40 repeat protein